MKNCYQENITQDIIDELETLKFVEVTMFCNFDYITVEEDGDYLEFTAEPVYERDEYGDYVKISDWEKAIYKKNSLSGVFQGVRLN